MTAEAAHSAECGAAHVTRGAALVVRAVIRERVATSVHCATNVAAESAACATNAATSVVARDDADAVVGSHGDANAGLP